MKTKFMFVDTDSIFFKIAYKSKNQSELRKNYNSFCNKMKMEVSDKLVNPFTDELTILYAVKGKGNFRKDLAPDYKSQRPELDQKVRVLNDVSTIDGTLHKDEVVVVEAFTSQGLKVIDNVGRFWFISSNDISTKL